MARTRGIASVADRPRRRSSSGRARSAGHRRLLVGIAHRGQDVARLGRAGRTGGAGRDGDPLEVERLADRGPVGVAGDDREESRQAVAGMAGQLDAGHGKEGRGEALAQLAEAGIRVSPARPGSARRRAAMPDGRRDVLRAGPSMALLCAALLLAEEMGPVPDVQCADPLGPLELVGGDREQVDPQGRDVDRQVGRGLDGVDVEQDAPMAVDPVGRSRRSARSCRPRCWRA